MASSPWLCVPSNVGFKSLGQGETNCLRKIISKRSIIDSCRGSGHSSNSTLPSSYNMPLLILRHAKWEWSSGPRRPCTPIIHSYSWDQEEPSSWGRMSLISWRCIWQKQAVASVLQILWMSLIVLWLQQCRFGYSKMMYWFVPWYRCVLKNFHGTYWKWCERIANSKYSSVARAVASITTGLKGNRVSTSFRCLNS